MDLYTIFVDNSGDNYLCNMLSSSFFVFLIKLYKNYTVQYKLINQWLTVLLLNKLSNLVDV
jgi:hypothetical protein